MTRRLILAIVLLMTGAACGADITLVDVTPYAGSYTLRSVNSFPLPYAILQSTDLRLEITDEAFSLASNSTFKDVTNYRRTAGAGAIDFPADTLTGSYEIRGQTISFTTSTGATFSGQVGLTSFTVIGNSTVFLYAK
ncbi:MAG: hypothetical protein ABI625_16030 [bacterium]